MCIIEHNHESFHVILFLVITLCNTKVEKHPYWSYIIICPYFNTSRNGTFKGFYSFNRTSGEVAEVADPDILGVYSNPLASMRHGTYTCSIGDSLYMSTYISNCEAPIAMVLDMYVCLTFSSTPSHRWHSPPSPRG